jgi:hypothetical protein
MQIMTQVSLVLSDVEASAGMTMDDWQETTSKKTGKKILTEHHCTF